MPLQHNSVRTNCFESRLSSPERRYAFDGKANNYPALADHSLVELGPTFVLAINLVLQVDQRIHSVGKRNDFRVAIDLGPAATVKGLCKDAKRSAGVAPQVVDLVSGLSTADDDPAFSIEPRRYWRHLEAPVLSPRRKHAPVMLCQKIFRAVDTHWFKFSHSVSIDSPQFECLIVKLEYPNDTLQVPI